MIHVFGVDHDSCMSFDGRPLKLEWLEFDHAFNQPFMLELKELVSSENLDKYAEAMSKFDMGENARRKIF